VIAPWPIMKVRAAPSQESFLAQLASLGDLGWDRVTAFQMDEDALLGSISTSCPATALRRHESAALYLDTQSARLFRSERRLGK
jgi:6-phosphogluconolactonase/glucosamine-6-phosphate isomerase/deaminase